MNFHQASRANFLFPPQRARVEQIFSSFHFVFVGHGVVVSMGFRFVVSMGLAVESEFELEGVGELRGHELGGGGGGGKDGNAILAVVDMYFRRDEFLLFVVGFEP